jgi:hypothetical protein
MPYEALAKRRMTAEHCFGEEGLGVGIKSRVLMNGVEYQRRGSGLYKPSCGVDVISKPVPGCRHVIH